MTFETYGLPAAGPPTVQVDQNLAAQQNFLAALGELLTQAVDARLAQQTQAVGVVAGALDGAVARRITNQGRGLGAVTNLLTTTVAARTAEQQTALSPYQSGQYQQGQAASTAMGLGRPVPTQASTGQTVYSPTAVVPAAVGQGAGVPSVPPGPAPVYTPTPQGGLTSSPPATGTAPFPVAGVPYQGPGTLYYVWTDPQKPGCVQVGTPQQYPPTAALIGSWSTLAQAQAQAASINAGPECAPVSTAPTQPAVPATGTPSQPLPTPTTTGPGQQPAPGVPVTPAPVPSLPPAPLPTPQTPPPSGSTCAAGPPLAFTIPLPGSAEWCAAQDDIRGFVVGVGQSLLAWVEQATDPATLLSGVQAALPSEPTGVVGSVTGAVAGSALAGLASLGQAALTTVQQLISCTVSLFPQFSGCDPIEQTALVAVRVVLDALGELEIGWDIALWSITHVRIDFPALSRAVDYLLESSCPSEVPGIPEAIECWVQGQIDEPTLRCWLAMRGASADVWAHVIDTRREKLQAHEWIEYARRNGASTQEQADGLRYLGWLREEERQARVALYDQLPTISDHLHWLQRNAFDDAYVQRFNLEVGFEERFWSKFGQNLTALGVTKDRARFDYIAHWLNPAPGQLFEMMRRLRPGRVDPSVVTTPDMVDLALAEQDVAPFWRPRLEATAYRVITLRFLRQMYQNGAFTDQEAAERYQDLGYSPADSVTLVQSEALLKVRTRATQAHGWTPARLAAGWTAGLVSEDDLRQRMALMGFTDPESTDLMESAGAASQATVILKWGRKALDGAITATLDAYREGVTVHDAAVQSLVQAGLPDAAASQLLDLEDTKRQMSRLRQAKGVVQRAHARGSVNPTQAEEELIGLGVDPTRAREDVNLWEAERRILRPVSSVAVTQRLLREGLITTEAARQRLVNLNWPEPDLTLYVAEAQRALLKSEAQAMKAQQTQQRQQAKQLQALEQAQERQLERTRAALRKVTPVATLKRWYKEGIIGDDYATSRLLAMGITRDVIGDYLADWGIDRAAYAAKQPAPTAPTATT